MNRDNSAGPPGDNILHAENALDGSSKALIRRTVIFLAVFALLQGLYSTAARDTWIERWLIDQVTVKSAASVIQAIDPSVGVRPLGSRLHAPDGGINVINGCDGVDVIFLLISAMLVAPISIGARLAGMGLGIVVTLILNQIRIISLFYAYRINSSVFDMLHGVVAPLMLIVAVSGYFLLWLSWQISTKGTPLSTP